MGVKPWIIIPLAVLINCFIYSFGTIDQSLLHYILVLIYKLKHCQVEYFMIYFKVNF